MPRFPKLLNLLKQLQKACASITRFGRKVGAAKKWFEVRSEKYIERPSTLAGRGLNEGHVNFVHVRALLTVHFHADKIFVQEFCDFIAFERFPFHHVTPMTSGVA